jgi:hypothetical protein
MSARECSHESLKLPATEKKAHAYFVPWKSFAVRMSQANATDSILLSILHELDRRN